MKAGDFMPFIVLGGFAAGLYALYKHAQSTCPSAGLLCSFYDSVFGTTAATAPVPSSSQPTTATSTASIQPLPASQSPAPVSSPSTSAPPAIAPPPPMTIPITLPQLQQIEDPCAQYAGLNPVNYSLCIAQHAGSVLPSQPQPLDWQLVTALQNAVGRSLGTVSEWNFVLAAVKPGSADLLNDPSNGAQIDADTYLSYRSQGGLSGPHGGNLIPISMIHRRRRMAW